MLDHLCITVSDLAQSKRFYARALAPLGYRMTIDRAEGVGFGVAAGALRSRDPDGDFWIAPGTPRPELVHFAFTAETHADVDAFHAEAIAAGGEDNGAPGLRVRYHPHYYAAFILDPDRYNIEAVCHDAARHSDGKH